jgi:hypothetical protein
MHRNAIWLALAILAIAAPASAARKDATKVTCAEFAAQSSEGQARLTSFLDGYSKRGQNVEYIDTTEVKRELDVLVVACQQDPKATVWDKIRAHIPGEAHKVHRVKMTCEEFLALGSSEQPEVAYWLAGYNSGGSVEEAGQVDVDRDIAVLVEACKPAPKEGVWSRIRSKL